MTLRTWMLGAAAAVALCGCATQSAYMAAPPETLAAAVSDGARPAADRDRDAARKPGEVVAFAGVRPGDRVGEWVPGGGYFTRVLAKVVGPTGRVYAFQPREVVTAFPNSLPGIQAVAAEPSYGGAVVVISQPFKDLAAPEPLDVVFTAQNYHDLYFERFARPGDSAAFNQAVFRTLKPGGAYVIIDHHARAGTGTADANTLHRIDVEAVKREVQQAGFVLEAESGILGNPADPRTTNVFDAAVRGKTDQFLLRFRKPG